MTYQKTQYRLTAALGLAVAVVASGMGGCAHQQQKPQPPAPLIDAHKETAEIKTLNTGIIQDLTSLKGYLSK